MKKTTLSIVLALASSAPFLQSAVITWDPVLVNTTAADIITDGTLHFAIDAASSDDTTVNGVLFTGAIVLGGNAESTFWTAGSGTHTTGDAGLDSLLDSHSWLGGIPSTGSFDFAGLTIGQQYDIQIIAVGDTRTCCSTRTQTYGGGGNFSDPLTRFDPSSVVGHFVADATTQSVTINGSQDGGFSGLQVRAVPEPASLSLLGLAGLLAFRRRR